MGFFKDSNLIGALLTLPIVSTIILGVLLTIYVFFNDYIMYELFTVMNNLFTSGLMSANFLDVQVPIVNLLNSIPSMIDFLFLISFISFVSVSIYISYKANRQDYFDILSYLSYGVIVFLFLLSIFKIAADYIYEMFFTIMLEKLTVSLSFYNYYINNMFWISLVILVANIVVNFIDLNNFKFSQKKQTELRSDEI